jgi:PIN domain nuclease of toxin-antitoxin system
VEWGGKLKLLIDTHYLIWAAVKPEMMERWALKLVSNLQNEILVSSASVYEIGQKVRRGRLPEAEEFERDLIGYTEAMGFILLPLEPEVMLRASRFPSSHTDPFDRMIAAQAIQLDVPVLSTDAALDYLGVRRLSGRN